MHNWKYTFRSLLAFITYAALCFASMRVGGPLAALTVGTVAVFASALSIVALIDNSGRRAFAIGFLVPFFAYVGTHVLSGGNQLNPFDDSALATTKSFAPIYLALRTAAWVDTATGNVSPDYDPSADPSRHQSWGMAPPAVSFVQSPNQETFSLATHSIIVVFLGLIGSNFAMYIYRTRDDG